MYDIDYSQAFLLVEARNQLARNAIGLEANAAAFVLPKQNLPIQNAPPSVTASQVRKLDKPFLSYSSPVTCERIMIDMRNAVSSDADFEYPRRLLSNSDSIASPSISMLDTSSAVAKKTAIFYWTRRETEESAPRLSALD